MTYASRMSAAHKASFSNRAEARAFRYRPGINAGRQRTKALPPPLVMGLIDRFMLGSDFPLDTWLATHETPKIRRAMEKLMAEVPVVNPEAYTPGGA